MIQDGQVVIKNEVTNDDPAGLLRGTTTLAEGELTFIDVSIGEQGQLYALTDDYTLYFRAGRSATDLAGSAWEIVDDYEFKQMDAGNNELFAVTMFNEVFRRSGLSDDNVLGDGWHQEFTGWMRYVSTAEEGIVWGIDIEYDVWVLHTGSISIQSIINNQELGWTLVEGQKLIQVDTGFNGYTVGLSEGGQTFWRNEITVDNAMGTSWSTLEGALGSDVTICGNGQIFMLNNEGGLMFRDGVKTYSASQEISLTDADRMGNSWESQLEGQAFKHVSCGKNGQTWLVNQDMTVSRCDTQDAANPECTSTQSIEMGGLLFTDIAAGQDGQVWGLDSNRNAVHRRGINRWNMQGSSWVTIDANLVHIDVGDCQVCGVTANHEIMCRNNVGSDTNKEGDDWSQLRGELMDVSVGYGPVLWGVDYGHNVWFKLLAEIKQFGQDGWTEVDKPDGVSKMVNIDVGRDGHVWGVDDNDKVYYREGIMANAGATQTLADRMGTHWWEAPNSNFVDVAVCTDGHVWAIGTDGGIYWRTRITDENQKGEAWEQATDDLCLNGVCQTTGTQISCGGGNVLVLGEN